MSDNWNYYELTDLVESVLAQPASGRIAQELAARAKLAAIAARAAEIERRQAELQQMCKDEYARLLAEHTHGLAAMAAQ